METGKIINKISNCLRRRSMEIQRAAGLPGTQGAILDYILVESGLRSIYQKDVEHEFGLRPSTATQILQALESSRLICRIPDEHDARLKKIVFTPEAESIREILKKEIEETEQLLLKDISTDELQTFLSTAHKMLKNLDS